jgi:hypothetical protein
MRRGWVAAVVLVLMAVGAPPALADPPTASCADATDVTNGSAVLHGTVVTGGNAVEYWFQIAFIGQGTALSTPATFAPGSTEPVEASAQVAGLAAGATYTYSLVVVSDTDQVQSTQCGFTTGASVLADGATAVGPTSATLNGLITAGPVGVQFWHFEWGTGLAYDQRTPSTPVRPLANRVSATITGLTPGTVYHWRLVITGAPVSPLAQDVFTTPAATVTAATEGVASVDSSSALLAGTVDTQGLPGS